MSVRETLPVAAIIVTWNTKKLTTRSIHALQQAAHVPKQIIVVDNGSDDDTVDALTTIFGDTITLISLTENLGFAKANNKAIHEVVDQPYVWLVNSDTEVGHNTLGQLVSYMDAHHDVGALGSTLVYPDGSAQSVGGYFPTITNVFRYLVPIEVLLPAGVRKKLNNIGLYPQVIAGEGVSLDYVTGAAMMLRTETLDAVGLLGDQYFMYFEEVDLCYRMAQAGWERHVIATDPVMHVHGGSFQTAFDKHRLRTFLQSLRLFVQSHYTGITRGLILAEVRLLEPISILIKRLKRFV